MTYLDPGNERRNRQNESALAVARPFFYLLRGNLFASFVCAVVILTPILSSSLALDELLKMSAHVTGAFWAAVGVRYAMLRGSREIYNSRPLKDLIKPNAVVSVAGSAAINVWMLWLVAPTI